MWRPCWLILDHHESVEDIEVLGNGVAVERSVAATRVGCEHGDGDLGRGVPCERPQQTLDAARVAA